MDARTEKKLIKAKQNIKKEDLEFYWRSNTTKDTIKHFGLTTFLFNTLVEEYCIERITKDDFIKYYINENHSLKETQQKFFLNSGEIVELIHKFDARKDKKLSRIISDKTKKDRYGDSNYNNRIKAESTCIEKYGVKNPFQDTDKIKESYINSLGVEHPMKRVDIAEKSISKHNYEEIRRKGVETYREKTGYDNPYENPEVINKIQETFTLKYGGHIATCPEIASKKAHKYFSDDGTTFDSNWEFLVYEYCKRNNLQIERNIPISFEYNGKKHTTLIDFKIDGLLFEVKGPHLLAGCFDYQQEVPIRKKFEIYRENQVAVITSDGRFFKSESGRHYNNNSLIGIDINLFINPDFPFDSNKPKCFYDVVVDKKLSSYAAFTNELIRWKMIKNRIEYSGGFICSKQILTALNVTRTCKQPSWFSEEYASYLIEKYITTDVIVDPFAGWGTRHDACIKFGKEYIGCDLNKALVEWHKSNGRNIQLCNACDFFYDGNCSVFICPPYQDSEVYFTGQDTEKTQCDWLSIVMKNVPNAKEYLMVCKTVDPGWEKYIVEEKINRSHFGTNKEYVLLIRQ